MNIRSNVLLGASVTGALLCIPVQAAGQTWEHTLTTYMVGSAHRRNGWAGSTERW